MSKPASFAYFTYKTLEPKQQLTFYQAIKRWLLKNQLLVAGLLVAALVITYLQPMFAIAVMMFGLILLTTVKSPTDMNVDYEAKILIKERAQQRKYFARINNFTYTKRVLLESTLFQAGDDNIVTNYIEGVIGGIPFWTADTRYEFESLENTTTVTKRTATAIFLEKSVPLIQLARKDGVLNDEVRSNINSKYKLMSYFDKYYECWLPAGYERDALYILTPELLELIIIYKPWFIEMQDKRVIIHDKFALETEEDYRQLAEMIQELGGEFIQNTRRYNRQQI